MIVGIGLDLVDVSRLRVQLASGAFQRRAFTPAELAAGAGTHDPAEHLAGKFAAKEALMKALGAGLAQGLTFAEIEILADKSGVPQARLSGQARERLAALGVSRIYLSITHTAGLAAAVVVLEKT